MITIIDEERGEVVVKDGEAETRHSLASAEGFAAASKAWLRATWDSKYVYSFAWMGRPVIQLPEDMIRLQEVIYTLKPDVLVETGVAHGGSLIFYASLFEAMGKGRVIGIDIEIRKHNREAIEAHEMFRRIELIEGSSTAPATLEQVKALIRPGEKVLVVLDSNHTRDHVLDELKLYGELIEVGSYVVATDGIMAQVKGGPRTGDDWDWNNPQRAVHDFVAQDKRFIVEEPAFPFNEGTVTERVTYWPDAFVKRIA
ncbi:cephalosporin hydroxylase family protein [Phenylobacterium sp. LH3H17]|uniref:cephalosporin hydroxylase family protein n=1 Tax=Phenylobacterium sp. LH3H17 TaxID=2903901 RepID=UPI0020C985A3|nr:CmcI family methyltransferase [Phenylobacterium sp. LH3H17]UTP39132.1 cephalosporin hydroxylase family protein [Phenylobacterium sp. LH3H17]